MQSTLGNSNCNFIKELLFIYSEQPPGCPAISWPRVASHSDPGLCWVWGLGSGRRTLLWRAAESTCSCELWPSLARLQLDAVYVDCLMANWCSMCWKHSFRHEAVMGGNMGCLNMIPISTVNLVNSVKKTIQPENQSEQLPEIIEATVVAWPVFSCLNQFSHSVCIALIVVGINFKNTEVTFKN